MAIYKLDEKVNLIKEISFNYEKEIQNIVEENIEILLGYKLIKSEFTIKNFRIDSLCFDNESKSFVIIEFKKDKNFSVIDQGYAYLSLMLNNKADFILEFNENNQSNHLRKNVVVWSQSRVIFISPSFTNYQREAINFKDLPIELWEIKQYENLTISFERMQKNNAKESIKTISKNNEDVEQVSNEIKVFTENDHLQNIEREIVEIYETFRDRVLNLGDSIELLPKKRYISFIFENKIFTDVLIQKRSLKIFLNVKKGELSDVKNIVRDVSDIGHLGNGSYEIQISDLENIDYIISLVKQSLKINKIEEELIV